MIRRVTAAALALLLVAVPVAAGDRDDFTTALTNHRESRAAINEGIVRLNETRDQLDVQLVEQAIAYGLQRIDAVGPRACYAEWWATTRAAYQLLAMSFAAVRARQVQAAQSLYVSSALMLLEADKVEPTVACEA
jgi:hypothetical protein